jgi:adenosylcobinamide-GDP ribazoletransferase
MNIKREADTFLCALMMLTRIPVPPRIYHEHHSGKGSPKYYSWIGIIIGGVSVVTLLLTANIFSIHISVLLSILATILLTGAFHEDGFADVCDGFGGGWTKDKILLIMKDSRLGTFGVLGLIGMLSFKFLVIIELSRVGSIYFLGAVIVAGHAISRFAAVTVMQQFSYISGPESKSASVAHSKLSLGQFAIAAAGSFIPLLFLPPVYWLSLSIVMIARVYAGRYFKRWIGGYTGDCLGATQQLSEAAFYSGVYLVWTFTS